MIKELKVLGEYELNTHTGKHLPTKEDLEKLTTKQDINTTKIISDLCNVELTLFNTTCKNKLYLWLVIIMQIT